MIHLLEAISKKNEVNPMKQNMQFRFNYKFGENRPNQSGEAISGEKEAWRNSSGRFFLKTPFLV
jgi:hypothetical protein